MTIGAEIPQNKPTARFVRAWIEEMEIPYTKKKIVLTETGEKEIQEVPMVREEDVLMVEYTPNPLDQQGRTNITRRWSDLIPSPAYMNANTYEGLIVRQRYEVLLPHVEAFQAGKMVDGRHGTPLTELPGITPSLENLLIRKHEMTCIEDLAEAPELAIRRIPHPEIRKLQRRARDFMATKLVAEGASRVSDDRLAKLEQENAALREMFKEFMAAQTAAAAASSGSDTETKRRGRRPAETTEAEHAAA
jgi:hypothetical protein